MKKIIFLFLLCGLVLFLPDNAFAANDDYEITLNYYRFDQDYSNWDVWIWANNADNSLNRTYEGNPFSNGTVSFGMGANNQWKQLKMTVSAPVDGRVGFIIRQNGWSGGREPGGDRFVDISRFDANNRAEAFLIESNETVYYRYTEVVSMGSLEPKIVSASIEKAREIVFSVNIPFKAGDAASFTMTGRNGSAVAGSFEADTGKRQGKFTADGDLDFAETYLISSANYGRTGKEVIIIGGFTTNEFNDKFYYGGELGALWAQNETEFRVWAPLASKAEVNLYNTGNGGTAYQTLPMTLGEKGVWSAKVTGNLNGVYYTYNVTNYGNEARDIIDPYAKACGVNGDRGMVIDLTSTNPGNWGNGRPDFPVSESFLYEVHVRDFTISPTSGVDFNNRGKYSGLVQPGTKNSFGQATGLDHIKELGVNTVHLIPVFDFWTVDETALSNEVNGQQFNWGYDPRNYNIPEGSYSSDPYNGEVRIKEFKQMVQAFHDTGIKVVMDVVYNHTGAGVEQNSFHKLVPGYYYRYDAGGNLSNGTGCGNETASERGMFRKFMLDSVLYWATEYHIDGFRFDLMGVHDIETMNLIRSELSKINENIIVYGEGWTGGSTMLADSLSALKENTHLMPGIAAFSDNIRDGIKGHVFTETEQGFVSGIRNNRETIKFGVAGSVQHPEIILSGVKWTSNFWAGAPLQTISYASAHDNLTLWDKLAISNARDSVEDRKKMNMLAAGIYYLAQGIPFMLSGEEMLRSKPKENGGFEDNSYESPDTVNLIDWDRKNAYKDVFEYYKGLIEIRKNFKSMVLQTGGDVRNNIHFFVVDNPQFLGYYTAMTSNSALLVYHNGSKEAVTVELPGGSYKVYAENGASGTNPIRTARGTLTVNPLSTVVLAGPPPGTGSGIPGSLGIALGSLAVLGAGCFFLFRYRDRLLTKR